MSKPKPKMKAFTQYVTIPFKNHGRDFKGCDCWGLIKLILQDYYEIWIPDYHISCLDYRAIHDQVEKDRPCWQRIDKPVEPCLILFKLHNRAASICNHVGLYIGNNEFIHTLKQHGATITSLNHPYFKAKLEGYYAINPCYHSC